ncbi:hypothetical protein [Methylovirgula sp. 4M-Z18]|uniref:hypothetical protein n=1 Tax=Methylovirgula sp. 4M-Z18 TaxID=2293567 RepID=UPI000E2FB86D|nr:hypothetical protein [Methylovirgula sp. 4M-Z18]RFB76630.1 hypothetical protein DYH55_19380 [Methylovirgula sp. 4M-Z18]
MQEFLEALAEIKAEFSAEPPMTDDELVEFATEFRDDLLGGQESKLMCAAVCWPLASYLRFCGVECKCVESDLGSVNHVWIKLADGRALDPNADQFNSEAKRWPAVYLGRRVELHI